MGSRTEAGAKCLSGGACVPESVIQSWRPDLRLVSAAAPLAPRAALRSPDQSGPTLPEARYPIAPQPRAPEAHKSPERRTPPYTGRSGDAVLCAASSAEREAWVPSARACDSPRVGPPGSESEAPFGAPGWLPCGCGRHRPGVRHLVSGSTGTRSQASSADMAEENLLASKQQGFGRGAGFRWQVTSARRGPRTWKCGIVPNLPAETPSASDHH